MKNFFLSFIFVLSFSLYYFSLFPFNPCEWLDASTRFYSFLHFRHASHARQRIGFGDHVSISASNPAFTPIESVNPAWFRSLHFSLATLDHLLSPFLLVAVIIRFLCQYTRRARPILLFLLSFLKEMYVLYQRVTYTPFSSLFVFYYPRIHVEYRRIQIPNRSFSRL